MFDRVSVRHDAFDHWGKVPYNSCFRIGRAERQLSKAHQRSFTFPFLRPQIFARLHKCRSVQQIEDFQQVADKVFRFVEKIVALLSSRSTCGILTTGAPGGGGLYAAICFANSSLYRSSISQHRRSFFAREFM
jgi:hypothetical protein